MEKNNTIGSVLFYSPQELLDHISSLFPKSLVVTRGEIKMRNGFLKLSDGKAEIDIVGLNADSDILVGSLVEIAGYLNYQVSGSGIYAKLTVKDIKVLEERGVALSKELMESIKKKKTNRGFIGYLFQLLEKEELIRIAVIHGKSAQVHRDFQNALINSAGAYTNYVELDFIESGLSDEELAQTLSSIADDSYHMIFILRGGGSLEELSRIGGLQTVQVIVEKDLPVYLALGHSLDKGLSLLEKVAEYSFPTPSIAGQELGRILKLYMSLLEIRKNYQNTILQLNTLNKDYSRLLSDKQILEKKIKETSQKIPISYILTAFAVGVSVGFLLKNLF